MQFDSWQAFWAMGGYGFFVWLAFGVSILALLGLFVHSLVSRRQLVQMIAKEQHRLARIQRSRVRQQRSETEVDNEPQT